MSEPYGLAVPESCTTCKAKQNGFFCNVQAAAAHALDTARYATPYPRGAVLFVEGQVASGIFILCQGRVKLSMSSRDGRSVILKIVGPGEILGLSATIAGKHYELGAETVDPCQVSFIKRAQFLHLMSEFPEISHRVIAQLSEKYNFACREIRALGLSRSTAEKFAKLLLDWSGDKKLGAEAKSTIKITFTHDEIAQMIGCSRETITRLMTDLKHKQVIHVHGCNLLIQNRSALERLAA